MLIFWIKVRRSYLDLSFRADTARRNWTWRYLYLNWNRSFALKPRPNVRSISTQHCWVQHVALRLATLLWRVATCWVLLVQIWKWSNFSCNICWCYMMLLLFGQVHATMLRLGMRISSIFNSQHVATRYNRVVKRVEHVAPNNVVICFVQMWRSLGWNLQILGQ